MRAGRPHSQEGFFGNVVEMVELLGPAVLQTHVGVGENSFSRHNPRRLSRPPGGRPPPADQGSKVERSYSSNSTTSPYLTQPSDPRIPIQNGLGCRLFISRTSLSPAQCPGPLRVLQKARSAIWYNFNQSRRRSSLEKVDKKAVCPHTFSRDRQSFLSDSPKSVAFKANP